MKFAPFNDPIRNSAKETASSSDSQHNSSIISANRLKVDEGHFGSKEVNRDYEADIDEN